MDLVLLVLAVLFLCIRSTGLGIATAITAIVYVTLQTITDIVKKWSDNK